MLHLRYSAGFGICFDFRTNQSSEYTKGSEYTSVTQGSVEQTVIDVWQVSEHSRTWIYKGREYAKILCKLYFKDS